MYVCLTAYVLCCYECGYRKHTPIQKFLKNIQKPLLQNVQPKFPSLKFLTQKTTYYTINPKTLLYHLRKGKVVAMDKGKSIHMGLTGKELQRKIK